MSVVIHVGDCRDVLAGMAEASVQSCVTSPPYYGLRDYGVDGQIGLEQTPDAYVAELVAVFREVRRVLRDDGTLWLNLGDSYAGSWGAQGHRKTDSDTLSWRGSQIQNHPKRASHTGTITGEWGLKPKDRMMIPARVALALQADGWWLRDEIVWHKPSPMPESVTDRTTKAHEMVYLLTKRERYFFDAKAIAEPATGQAPGNKQPTKGGRHYEGGAEEHRTAANLHKIRPQSVRAREIARQHGLTDAHIAAIRACGVGDAGKAQSTQSGFGKNDPAVQALADEAKAVLGGYTREFLLADTKNRRSVWTIAARPFAEAHFATMPPDLADLCIRAGSRPGDMVLDPFGGAGTTALAADRLQRNATIIELNPAYAAIARERINGEAPLFAAAGE